MRKGFIMEYRKRQIQRIIDKAKNSDYLPSIKITSETWQTNCLNITVDELRQIQEILKIDIVDHDIKV